MEVTESPEGSIGVAMPHISAPSTAICPPHASALEARGTTPAADTRAGGPLPIGDGATRAIAGLAADAGPQPGPAQQVQQQQQQQQEEEQEPQRKTCLACRKSKVRCDRKYPCSRCVRLDLVCLPQTTSKGRVSFGARKHPLEQLYDQSTGAQCEGDGLTRQSILGVEGRVYVGYPHLAAEILIARFAKIWAAGQMARAKTISVLRSWAFWNMLHGSDCSLGALSIISKILDFDHVGHVLGSTGPRGSSLPDDVAHLGAADQGLEDRAAVCQVLLKFGELVVQCNWKFEQGFMTTQECKQALRFTLIRPEYLWARFIARDNYKEFYESMCGLHFQCHDRTGEFVHILGCVDRFGADVRCITRCSMSVSESGDYYSISLLLLPLPDLSPTILPSGPATTPITHGLPGGAGLIGGADGVDLGVASQAASLDMAGPDYGAPQWPAGQVVGDVRGQSKGMTMDPRVGLVRTDAQAMMFPPERLLLPQVAASPAAALPPPLLPPLSQRLPFDASLDDVSYNFLTAPAGVALSNPVPVTSGLKRSADSLQDAPTGVPPFAALVKEEAPTLTAGLAMGR